MDVALGVLNLFYMFSKRSNFIARLNSDKKTTLLNRLKFLAENWGFSLANCCKPDSEFNEKFDQGFYYQFYTKDGNLESIEIKNIKQFKLTHTASLFTKHVWQEIIDRNGLLDDDQKFHILSRVRLLWQFDNVKYRLLFVQARLQALSVLVYSDALSEQTHSLIYPGLLEEIVDLIKYDIKSSQHEESLVEIRAAALRTLTAIIHLERNTQYLRKSESRLSIIIDVTGASSYHGFLPSLVRSCINNLISEQDTSASLQKLATALFSFLYHLASYESGAESLVSCGMMEPLLRVINWKSVELDHITFVTRAVRVIDLITNLDMQMFQQLDGLNIFVDRLNIEISLCRQETPYEIVPKRYANPEETPPHQPAALAAAPDEAMMFEDAEDIVPESQTVLEEPEIEDDRKPINRVKHYLKNQRNAVTYDEDLYALQKKPIGHDNTKTKSTDKTCLPQRAALLKSMLNFLKKAIQDSVFSESIRQVMDGSLPNSLKHIISNAEYYGPSLFLLATDVATVYVYHEPSLLSSLQDNGLTDVILQALLAKEVPATREVLGSLPNIFGALCLNERGLNEFLHYKPFDMLSRIFLSPVYLNAMRRRRSAEPGDTAAIFGKAMDDLMRNQTSLKEEAIKAIIKLLKDLRFLGTHPQFVCWRGHKNEASSSSSSHGKCVVQLIFCL
jgi:E3 ubiquitin-protein ligase HUWE1